MKMIDASVIRKHRPWALSLAAAVLAVGLSPAADARSGLPDFTALVQDYAPAVVNISTTQTKTHPRVLPKGLEMPDIPEDSPFYDFFRRFFGEGPGGGGDEEFDAQSLGSGFILSADGYIVTNFHVIKEADEVIVRLQDRREFAAEVVGTDERSDLALLRVKADNLPAVKVGRSAGLKVGEWVLAIGAPFGFEHSVTAGIVSAIGRSLPSENYVPFIQTDVAINPGNSGGPLFNLDGEVVGVNSQIYSRTGGFMGLSFAIPVDVAMDVIDQLKSQGKVSRGWLGVLIQDVTRELAESFGMERPRGALVARVLPGSPAETAGFSVGDVVLQFGEDSVSHSSDLPPIVGKTRVGSKVPVKVLREGKPRTLTVTIGELPEDEELQAQAAGRSGPAADQRMGVSVVDLTQEQRKQLEVTEGGVIVSEVGDGPGYRAGIRKDDVVLMLNGVRVKDAAHFKELASGLPDNRPVPVLVQRRGSPLFLALKLP
jgi:serine protease Do